MMLSSLAPRRYMPVITASAASGRVFGLDGLPVLVAKSHRIAQRVAFAFEYSARSLVVNIAVVELVADDRFDFDQQSLTLFIHGHWKGQFVRSDLAGG